MSHPTAIDTYLELLRSGLTRPDDLAHRKDKAGSASAAVLVPLFEAGADLNVVYIRRSDHIASHRGQVAFPGGRIDPSDPSPLAAALREAREEVGIEPDSVSVLGAFPNMETLTSGISVSAFVGLIPPSPKLRLDPREVAEIFDVPLRVLRDPRYRGKYRRKHRGKTYEYPAIVYARQTIWGLTLRITLEMLEILDGVIERRH